MLQMSEFEYRSYFESTLYSAGLLDERAVGDGAPARTPANSGVVGVHAGDRDVGDRRAQPLRRSDVA